EIEPLAVKNSAENEFGNDRRDDREGSPLVAFEDAVEEMPEEQDQRDEERRDVAVVKAQTTPRRGVNRVYWLDSRVAHSWSTDYADLRRFFDFINLIHPRFVDRFDLPGRPTDLSPLDLRVFAKPEMQATLVLRTEAIATRNRLHLLPSIPKQLHLRADRTAITRRTLQLEIDPFILRRHIVFINQQRPALIRHDHVQHAAIPQIDKRH